MTCKACDRAQHNPASGIYQANCINCEARAIAQGPEAATREADPGDLQARMRMVWKEESQYRKGRTLVWGWIKRLSRETYET